MISKQTAADIWNCYQEIDNGKALLGDIQKAQEEYHRATPRENWERGTFELGVPMSTSGHRIFKVQPKLAESVIRAHIANKQSELAEANERARLEVLS